MEKKKTKTLYRIQSIKQESLWYSIDGKFEDKLKKITGQEIPMPFEEWRQLDQKVKLLSSVKNMEDFKNWFTKDQIYKMFNSGYSLFKYEVTDPIVLPRGEVLFDLNNSVIECVEIQNIMLPWK